MALARVGCLVAATALRAASLDDASLVQVDASIFGHGHKDPDPLTGMMGPDGKPLDKKQIKKELEADINKIGSFLPRQMTEREIEANVINFRNYTKIVSRMPSVSVEWVAPLFGPDDPVKLVEADENASAATLEFSTLMDRLNKSLSGAKKVLDLHHKALNHTYAEVDKHSPPGQMLTSRPAQQVMLTKAGVMSETADGLRRNLSEATDVATLCAKAGKSLTELRKRTKQYAEGCDVLLFMMPPPLPDFNPWMNATMLESVRGMYSASKNAMKDVGEGIEKAVVMFLKKGADCDVEVAEPVLNQDWKKDWKKGDKAKEGKKSRSSAPRPRSALATAAAAAAALLALGSGA